MKIAVISDIHGNIEAIQAVFEDIKKQECEKIFVLGDYAMAGPQPQEAIEYFIDRYKDKNITMIQGNTDLMIANYSTKIYDKIKVKAPIMAEALKNDAQIINDKAKEFLENLPPQKEVKLGGIKFLLVHGSPRKNDEDILPDTPMKSVSEMIKDVDADVILCGHTHIPCGFQTETKQTVINAGSIGRPFTPEPNSCYLTIEVKDAKCVFEHHFIKYDNQTACEKLSKREFKGADKLANMLLTPSDRHF